MLATPGDEVLAQELFRRSERTDLAASIGPRLLGELVSRFRPRQRLEYDRCEIELAVSSGFSYKRLRAAQKEPFTVEWLERSIRPGAVLFDIGANVGAYSLIAAKLADGDVTVYAFEPAAPSFADLSRNIALNGCERSVIPLPLALWDRTGAVTFGYRSLEPGDAGHAVSDDRGSASASESSQRALAFRLDDLVAWFELPTPTLVKLDVDGPELKVLEGATATMSDARCRELMIEIDGLPDERNAVAITELLARCGFELAQRHDRGQGAYCLFAKG
jgi:FkbM family methyltransferase